MRFLKKLWKGYVEFTKRCIIARGNLDSFSKKTSLKCPNCRQDLYQIFGTNGGYPQNYVCRKCGYTGALGLEIDVK